MNNRVQIFRKSDGVFVRELKQETCPYYISIKDDELFVTDFSNARVVVFQG